MANMSIFYQRFICRVIYMAAIILIVGCTLAKNNISYANNSSGNSTNPKDNDNNQQTTKLPSPQVQTWHLNQTKRSADVFLQINQAETTVEPRLAVTVDAVTRTRTSLSQAANNKPKLTIPEHYLTITITCTNHQTALKTSTLTTYPLGDTGTFILQRPALEPDCFNEQGIAKIKVTLQLILPDTSENLELRGDVILEPRVPL